MHSIGVIDNKDIKLMRELRLEEARVPNGSETYEI